MFQSGAPTCKNKGWGTHQRVWGPRSIVELPLIPIKLNIQFGLHFCVCDIISGYETPAENQRTRGGLRTLF